MKIMLSNISKRYGKTWIFRNVSEQLESGSAWAITGSNGSGKSTLLKVISGGLAPSTGEVVCTGDDGRDLSWSDMAAYLSYTAPYTDIIEQLTLREHLDFHFRFKRMRQGYSIERIIEELSMVKDQAKQIRDFSSGMKQRVKLALAIYSEDPVMLLDEPTSNLDEDWSNWYVKEVSALADSRLIVVASNQPREYSFCSQRLDMADF